MSYKIESENDLKYIVIPPESTKMASEKEAMDLLSACFETNVRRILFSKEVLTEDFYTLKTGLAGAIAQKFTNYQVKAVFVVDEAMLNDRFKEFALESNKGCQLGFFADETQARQWLLQ